MLKIFSSNSSSNSSNSSNSSSSNSSSSTGDDVVSSVPKVSSSGLFNIANTCYLNSLLQSYYWIPSFRNLIMTYDYQDAYKRVQTQMNSSSNHNDTASSSSSSSFSPSSKNANSSNSSSSSSSISIEMQHSISKASSK